MMRLILMRHGEAERPHPGLEDFDRALDDDGRAECRRIARFPTGSAVVFAIDEAGQARLERVLMARDLR